MLRSIFTTLLLACIAATASHAQITFCQDPPPDGAPTCKTACYYCNIDGQQGSLFTSFGQPTVVCDGTQTLHGPRWYGFIAGASVVGFNISCGNTPNPKAGITALITSNCQSDKPLACETTGQFGPGASLDVVAFNLIPGQPYQLGIGGIDDTSRYEFTITDLYGSAKPPQMSPLSPITGPTDVCPFAEVTYSIQNITNALTITWVAPPGASIDGGGNVRTYPGQGSAGRTITVRYGAVGGQLCVRANAYCQPQQQQCLTIVNKPIPPTVLPDLEFCLGEDPYVWPEEPFFELFVPGTFNLTSLPYKSYLGCDSLVKQKITIRPGRQINLGKRYLCEGECFPVGGTNYCNAGNYEVTLSTAFGCDSIVRFIIEKIPAEAVIQAPNLITCANSAITLTNNGSTTGTGVNYLWRNGQLANIGTGSSVTVNSAGNYYLIVSNTIASKTCRDTAQVFVSSSTDVPTANAGPPRTLTCTTNSVQLTGNGSVGPQYQYLWTASGGGNITLGSNTLTATANAAGTYTLRVTNTNNGCTSESITTVTLDNAAPGATVAGGSFNCTTPTLGLQLTTGTTGATFAWAGPSGFTSTVQNPTVSTGGTYTVTVTNPANGCTSTASTTVIADTAPPGATATGGTLTCELAQVPLAGSSPATGATFAWAGPGGFTSTAPNPTVGQAGTYTLTVTGTNGCTSTAAAAVNLDNAVPSATVAPSGNLNCNNQSINLVATPTNGTSFNFNWQNPDGSTTSTGSTPLLNVNAPGQYILQTTNTANGCSSTTTATVVQNAAVAATADVAQNISCNGGQNGSATATGTGGNGTFTYSWSSGASTATATGLTAGNYVVTVTDGEGCTSTASATLSQPDALAANASATAETGSGANDGTATANPAGGTAPYTYEWETSATTQTVTGLAPGSYDVTVSDANGCTAVQTVTVNAYNCALSADIQANNVNCAGENNGSASVQLVGAADPVTYAWSTGVSTESVSGLAPGTYSVSLTDANGCPAELTFAITEPAPLVTNASATNASGTTSNDGTATSNPTGGTAPYTYLWNNGETTQTITGLAPGFYTVIVTDANGCISVFVVQVGLDCALSADFANASPTCNGLSNGSITASATGSTGNVTYNWSTGGTSATITNLAAGTYTVTINDDAGCQTTLQTTLVQPAALGIAVVDVQNTVCPNDPLGSATVAATGGTGNLNYTWNNGQVGPTATNLAAGNYTAAATDANGCEISTVVTVAANDTQAPTISGVNLVIPIGPSGVVVLDDQNTGVQTADNCLVTGVSFSPASFDCNEQGQHVVTATATDAAGNSASTDFTVTIVDNSAPDMQCSPSIVRCFGNNVVAYQLPSAEDNCEAAGGTFALVNGLPSGSQFPLGTTTVTYSFTDAASNVGSCSFEVTVLSQLTLAVGAVTNDVDNQQIGSIQLSTTGSLSPYTYAWTKDGQPIAATTEDLTNIGAGNYQVIVTDANGCTSQSQVIPVSNTIGTDEPTWAIGFSLQPNPTSGQLSAIFPETMRADGQITVFDATGRKVSAVNFTGESRVELDLSALPDGLYSVRVQVGRKGLMRKIVVAKN
ncbi:MAG: HYR domain-containing protein [Saprospiraceae bacterium]